MLLYNSVLVMYELMEKVDCVLFIENQVLVDIVNKIGQLVFLVKLGKRVYNVSGVKVGSVIIDGEGGLFKVLDEKLFDSMNNIVVNFLFNMIR